MAKLTVDSARAWMNSVEDHEQAIIEALPKVCPICGIKIEYDPDSIMVEVMNEDGLSPVFCYSCRRYFHIRTQDPEDQDQAPRNMTCVVCGGLLKNRPSVNIFHGLRPYPVDEDEGLCAKCMDLLTLRHLNNMSNATLVAYSAYQRRATGNPAYRG